MDKLKQRPMDADELFRKYMHLMCERESEKTYRLKSDAGEGIMRSYNVENGIELVYAELESYYPLAERKNEKVDYIEIMFMVEGHADFEMENRRVASVDKGDICIFSSRVGAKKCSFGKEGMRSISIIVLPELLEGILNRFFDTNEFSRKKLFSDAMNSDCCIRFPADDMLKSTFSELMQLPGKYSECHRKLLTMRAIIALLDTKNGEKPDFRYFSGNAGNKAHNARKLLGENLASDISIEELSAAVKLNRTTLQSVFRQMYGVSIFEYRTQVRMQEAKNLLLEDRLSVTEIAGLCGYSNASKFSAAFKKCVGVTPKEYRQKT